MKKDIHPDFKEVVFRDVSCDFMFLTKSTINAKDTVEFEGKTYPVVNVDISSESHPFFTGKQKLVDSEGRVERFKKKFARYKKN